MEWMPIETAPRDGAEIIAARFSGSRCSWLGAARWDDCDPDYHAWYCPQDDQDVEPTHWMPLPPPPTGGE